MSQTSDPLGQRSGKVSLGAMPWARVPRFAVPERAGTAIAFALTACAATWILASLHDRFWWPPDDGAYAHVASRLLAGEVLHRDVQDVHAGYVNFANAGALALFGDRLVSLRYPLAILTLCQSCLMFFMLRPKGATVAAAGATGMAALTFVQFLNPTAHWYALFLVVTLLAALIWMPGDDRRRLLVTGFLLTTLFLFRQLTGILVGIGILTYLLCENPALRPVGQGVKDRLLARTLLAVMALGLAAYLFAKTDAVAFAMFGLAPLGIIALAWIRTDLGNREVGSILLVLAAGSLAALGPLLLYHLANGSVGAWIDDTVLAAFALTELPFFEKSRFLHLMILALGTAATASDGAALINGLYWAAALLLAPAMGYLTLRGLLREGGRTGARPYVLPLVASFHGVVAVHFQIPIYLIYTLAMSLAGLLWLAAAQPGPARCAMLGLTACLCATGLYFHAGQPASRGLLGIVAGHRHVTFEPSGIARAGLRLDADDAATYRDLVDLIRRETPEDGAILAVPVNPELYYLSGRRNPTRFFNSALGIRTDRELQSVLADLRRDPPGLVFFRPDDKYWTRYAARIMDFVRLRYEPLVSRAGFEIFRYPGTAHDDARKGGGTK